MTFTFVTLGGFKQEGPASWETRTVFLRYALGRDVMNEPARHLDRFMLQHGLKVEGACMIDAPSLADAKEVLGYD